MKTWGRPMVERAAFAMSVNEAWALLAAVALVSRDGKPRYDGAGCI